MQRDVVGYIEHGKRTFSGCLSLTFFFVPIPLVGRRTVSKLAPAVLFEAKIQNKKTAKCKMAKLLNPFFARLLSLVLFYKV